MFSKKENKNNNDVNDIDKREYNYLKQIDRELKLMKNYHDSFQQQYLADKENSL
jgi:hypothetical protein